MATITLYYFLSLAGQTDALLKEVNAGSFQRIILCSPSHVAMEDAKFLRDPDVTVEVATHDVWAMAVSLAVIDDKGRAHLRCGYDTESFTAIVGYTVDLDRRTSRYLINPQTASCQFDRRHSATELLQKEKQRRDSLLLLAQKAEEERAAKQV